MSRSQAGHDEAHRITHYRPRAGGAARIRSNRSSGRTRRARAADRAAERAECSLRGTEDVRRSASDNSSRQFRHRQSSYRRAIHSRVVSLS